MFGNHLTALAQLFVFGIFELMCSLFLGSDLTVIIFYSSYLIFYIGYIFVLEKPWLPWFLKLFSAILVLKLTNKNILKHNI